MDLESYPITTTKPNSHAGVLTTPPIIGRGVTKKKMLAEDEDMGYRKIAKKG